jgi:exopolyphosphatase/guanosine-5'-triphosphate,3'-diphosphate pyrophosphatase
VSSKSDPVQQPIDADSAPDAVAPHGERAKAQSRAESDHHLVGVLDMGASAIRLVIAEIAPGQPLRIIEEASRGLLLGRDTFSTGSIQPHTIDATLAAVDKFRSILDSYGVNQIRAVATSAVREARNGDLFLDRVAGRTGVVFETINEAEESRLVYRAVHDALRGHAALKGAATLLAEVGGGSTSLTLLRRGQPSRSGVYALGAVRLRQRLDLNRLRHDLQAPLLNRSITTIIEEIRLEIPLSRVKQMVAIGGDVRFAAAQIQGHEDHEHVWEISREAFLTFCAQVEQMDEESLANRFRLPAVEAETLVPALLIYRALLSQTAARRLIVSDASLRAGMLLDLLEPAGRLGAEDFNRQVMASAEALGHRFRFDRAHGRHVAMLAARLFDELRDEHRLSDRERLLLETAGLLHDIGIYVSLRAHHKHSQYLLAASQIFGLSDEETAIVSNIARYHRRGTPQKSHLPYIALDRRDRLMVNKLAAMLRVANALDAEHLQKVRDLRLERSPKRWILQLEGTGDLTMERMAATARADLFTEVFGRPLVIRQVGVVG